MRDTPMVDAMMKFCFGTDEEFVRIKDAAKLERELNAANERIKRLVEAGDALYENSDPTRWDSLQAANRKLNDQEAWRKAKEDKP